MMALRHPLLTMRIRACVGVNAVTRRRSRRPARSWKHVPVPSPMIQRPVTPYDIVMQHLHRGEGRGRKREGNERGDTKEAARMVGALTKALERLARPLCVRVQWRKPQCIISRNGTLTPSVFCGLSLRRQEPHKATERTHWRERAAIHGKLISRDARLRRRSTRVVNTYGGIIRFDCSGIL